MIAKEPSLCNQIGSISILFRDLKAKWLQKNRPFAIKLVLSHYYSGVNAKMIAKEPSLCNQIGSISLLFNGLIPKWLQKNRPFAIKKRIVLLPGGGFFGWKRIGEKSAWWKYTALETNSAGIVGRRLSAVFYERVVALGEQKRDCRPY